MAHGLYCILYYTLYYAIYMTSNPLTTTWLWNIVRMRSKVQRYSTKTAVFQIDQSDCRSLIRKTLDLQSSVAVGISRSNLREQSLFSTELQLTSRIYSATHTNNNHHAFNDFKGKRRASSQLQEQGQGPRRERPLISFNFAFRSI